MDPTQNPKYIINKRVWFNVHPWIYFASSRLSTWLSTTVSDYVADEFKRGRTMFRKILERKLKSRNLILQPRELTVNTNHIDLPTPEKSRACKTFRAAYSCCHHTYA